MKAGLLDPEESRVNYKKEDEIQQATVLAGSGRLDDRQASTSCEAAVVVKPKASFCEPWVTKQNFAGAAERRPILECADSSELSKAATSRRTPKMSPAAQAR